MEGYEKHEGQDPLRSTKETILETLKGNSEHEFIIQFEIEGDRDEEKEREPS